MKELQDTVLVSGVRVLAARAGDQANYAPGSVVATSDDGGEAAVVFDHLPDAVVPVPTRDVRVTARNQDDEVRQPET